MEGGDLLASTEKGQVDARKIEIGQIMQLCVGIAKFHATVGRFGEIHSV